MKKTLATYSCPRNFRKVRMTQYLGFKQRRNFIKQQHYGLNELRAYFKNLGDGEMGKPSLCGNKER